LNSQYGIELLLKFFADKLPRMGEIGLSGTVLLFTLGLSILTGLLSGLLPALGMTKGDVSEALKQGLGRMEGRAAASRGRPWSPARWRYPWFCSSVRASWCAACGNCKAPIRDSMSETFSP
jgi:hypothetical protein